MVNGEGSLVTIKYRTPLLAGSQPSPDPVYGNDTRVASSGLQTTTAKCMIHIVHERDFKILGFGIVQTGDSILYFLDNLNLLEPIAGKAVLPGTLFFIDPYGGQWMPILEDTGPLVRYLAMVINNEAMAQAVPCNLKK